MRRSLLTSLGASSAASPHDPLVAAHRRGALSDLDLAFVDTLVARFGDPGALARWAAAAVSGHVSGGHTCVDLAAIGGESLRVGESARDEATWPSADQMRAALLEWSAVAHAEVADLALADDAPLVLHGERLYVARYWHYERDLVRALGARASDARRVPAAAAREALATCFPDAGPAHDGQRVAACVALRGSLSVIVGGPGTGKTTTVVRLLAALAMAEGAPPRVVLLAPTGKAAARLAEAVQRGVDALPASVPAATRAALRVSASTIHRALGVRRDAPTQFVRSAQYPLNADVVVVDEASMVDMALMAKLVDAVPPRARLILLGDADQLASVEAGAVLGALVGGALGHVPSALADDVEAWLDEPPALVRGESAPVRAAIAPLRHSWRYATGGPIGRVAVALQEGRVDDALDAMEPVSLDALGSDEGEFVRRIDPAGASLRALLAPWVGRRAARAAASRDRVSVDGVSVGEASAGGSPVGGASVSGGPLHPDALAEAALAELGRVQVLCAHRKGAFGVGAVNRAFGDGLGVERVDAPFDRRPVLITRNAPALGLYNGDVGVTVVSEGSRFRVCFAGPEGIRTVASGRLPAHETVFGMTIHKSQGSEYDEVVVVLPEASSPILTRELLYTAVTRARRRVTLLGSDEVIRSAIGTPLRRSSGLRSALWGA